MLVEILDFGNGYGGDRGNVCIFLLEEEWECLTMDWDEHLSLSSTIREFDKKEKVAHPRHYTKNYCPTQMVQKGLSLKTKLVWTPCLMHRCVISTMFGSCFRFFIKTFIFLIFLIFMCFLLLLLFFIIKIKCFFFTFVFLFICMQVWSLEKEDTLHSFFK